MKKCNIKYPHDFPDTPCERCNATELNLPTTNWVEEEYKKEHCANCFEAKKNCECKIKTENDKLDKITQEIKLAKEETQKQTGSFKYDDCYDECLEIINKYN